MLDSKSRIVLKQLGLLCCVFFLIYGCLIAVTYIVMPPPRANDPVDAASAPKTVFTTDPKFIYLSHSGLATAAPKLILLGDSTTQRTFNRAQLQALMPDRVVNNLAVSASNVTELRQIFQLAKQAIPPGSEPSNVYAVGVWYGLFVTDQMKWNASPGGPITTDIDRERYRYGFAHAGPHGAIALFPDSDIRLATIAVYPLIAMDRITHLLGQGITRRFFVRPAVLDEAQENTEIMSLQDRQDALAYRATVMGPPPLSDQQFLVLDQLIGEVRNTGARFVLMNNAIPHWHSTASPYEIAFQAKLAAVVARHRGDSGFVYLDLSSLDTDANFYDDAHLRPSDRGPWLQHLAQAIHAMPSVPRDYTSVN